MQPVSFKRHRFPPDVIRLAVWLCFRFTLSFRDVEEMLAQRGIEVSYETARCWALKFGDDCLPAERRSGSFTAAIDTDRDACSPTIERGTRTWSAATAAA